MGREAFISELDLPLNTFHLANSSGQITDADSETGHWENILRRMGQPSRHKLYIVYKHPMVSGYVVSHNFIYIIFSHIAQQCKIPIPMLGNIFPYSPVILPSQF